MNPKKNLKSIYLVCFVGVVLFALAGRSFLSFPMKDEKKDTWADSGRLEIGHDLTIKNTANRLTFLDSKDVLSANGLYYAAWTIGQPEPYENSEGQTVDLYDAQLYLVLSEHKSEEEARTDMTKWLDTGKSNYSILTEEEILCNGQSYQLITYNFANENNPYAKGISAFCVHGKDSLCIELACRESFEEDPRTILLPFLEGFTYR